MKDNNIWTMECEIRKNGVGGNDSLYRYSNYQGATINQDLQMVHSAIVSSSGSDDISVWFNYDRMYAQSYVFYMEIYYISPLI